MRIQALHTISISRHDLFCANATRQKYWLENLHFKNIVAYFLSLPILCSDSFSKCFLYNQSKNYLTRNREKLKFETWTVHTENENGLIGERVLTCSLSDPLPRIWEKFFLQTKKKKVNNFLLAPRSFQQLVLLGLRMCCWFDLLYCRCYQHNWFLYRSSNLISRILGNLYGSHIYFRIFAPNQRHLIVWNTENNQWIERVEGEERRTDGVKSPGGTPWGAFQLSMLLLLQQKQI